MSFTMMHVRFYSLRQVYLCRLKAQISGGSWILRRTWDEPDQITILGTVEHFVDWQIQFIITDVWKGADNVGRLNLAKPMHCGQAVCVGVCLRGWQMIRRCEGTAVCSLGPLGKCLLLAVLSAHLLKPPSGSLSLFPFSLHVKEANWNASSARRAGLFV